MANNPNVLDNLRPFKKGKDSRRDKSGRKPLLVTDVLRQLKEKGYEPVGKEQIVSLYTTLLALPIAELKKIGAEEKQPMLNRIIVGAILNRKGFENIETMLDRAHGKPDQKVKADVNLNVPKLMSEIATHPTMRSVEEQKKSFDNE